METDADLAVGPVGLFKTGEEGLLSSHELPVGDAVQVGRAVRDIGRSALARIDHRSGALQVHRLVSTVLSLRMTDDERADTRRTARLLLSWQPPGPALTGHLLASGAAEDTDHGVRRAVRAQLEWLALNGMTEEGRQLLRVADETGSHLDGGRPWRDGTATDGPAR